MNVVVICGILTRDAVLTEGPPEDRIAMDVAVGDGEGRDQIWVRATLRGKKCREVVDDLWQGQVVTITGIINGRLAYRDPSRGGPTDVVAIHVVPHEIIAGDIHPQTDN